MAGAGNERQVSRHAMGRQAASVTATARRQRAGCGVRPERGARPSERPRGRQWPESTCAQTARGGDVAASRDGARAAKLRGVARRCARAEARPGRRRQPELMGRGRALGAAGPEFPRMGFAQSALRRKEAPDGRGAPRGGGCPVRVPGTTGPGSRAEARPGPKARCWALSRGSALESLAGSAAEPAKRQVSPRGWKGHGGPMREARLMVVRLEAGLCCG